MASNSLKNQGKEVLEDVSKRTLKRKRALDHYRRKHKQKSYTLDDTHLETSYYFENGMRKVYPYKFFFKTYVKGRWLGQKVIDVLVNEFKGTPADKQLEAVKNGQVFVNGQPVTPDFILRENQLLEHQCHRHENPVLDTPIEFLVDTPDLLVINKPASIPCHPCGRYRYNSVTFILEKEFGYKDLRTLYRLDRLTSGLLMLPKTTTLSKKLESQLEKKMFEKEYICRVVGKFPDGEVTCNEPIDLLSRKLSIYGTSKHGKPSSTSFTRLSYNGRSSVVKCVPHTGRTHQIRVHLQHLGFPITNDPLYNSTAFGAGKGKDGVRERTLEEIEDIIMETTNGGMWKIGDNPLYIEKFGADGKKPTRSDVLPMDDSEYESSTSKLIDSNDMGIDESSTEQKISESDSTDVQNAQKSCKEDGAKCTEMETDLTSKNEENFGNEKDDSISECRDTNFQKEDKNMSSSPNPKRVKREEHTAVKTDTNTDDGTDRNEPHAVVGRSSKVTEPESEGSNDESTNKVTLNCDGVYEIRPGERPGLDKRKLTVDRNCENCKYLYAETKPSEMLIYLHAVRYKGPDFEYSTELPYWAKEDFTDEDIKEDHIP